MCVSRRLTLACRHGEDAQVGFGSSAARMLADCQDEVPAVEVATAVVDVSHWDLHQALKRGGRKAFK